MKILRILLTLLLTLSFFSCQKEDITPNTNMNQSDSSSKSHDIEVNNTLEFSFWLSSENVNGTIKLHYDGNVETINISDLQFEDKESLFFNIDYKCVTITKTLSNEDLSDDTYFFVEINVGRNINILNENTINGDYMFISNNDSFLEPSKNTTTESSTLSTNAWVLVDDILKYERRISKF